MIEQKEYSTGYLFSIEQKGGPGSGIEGHRTNQLNQFRNEKEKRESQRGLIAFHATYGSVLDGILKNGILPGGGKGGKRNDPKPFFTGDRKNAVFITQNKQFATTYSQDIMVKRKAKFAVIFEVEIPKHIELKPDKFYAKKAGAFFVQNGIPIKYIKSYEILEEVMVGKWPEMRVISRHSVNKELKEVYFVPIILE